MAFRILVIDVETTGLPKRRNAPVTEVDNWPHPVQIAWIYYKCAHAGHPGRILQKVSHIIYPASWTIPEDSARIHGITCEYALRHGVSLEYVITDLQRMALKSDAICCHNVMFDVPVLVSSGIRCGIPVSEQVISKKPTICTMEVGKSVCNIVREYKGKHGTFRKLKPPKLCELYRHLFHREFEGKFHDALEDCRCTVEIVDILMRLYRAKIIEHCPSLFCSRR